MKDRISELAPDFAAGVAVGDFILAGGAFEFYGHTELGHSATVMARPFAKACHILMLACGVSPNDMAVGHRLHHRDGFVPDGDSIDDGIRFVGHEMVGEDFEDLPSPNDVLVPRLPVEMDRLVKMDSEGNLVERVDWPVEKAISTSPLTRAIPPLLIFGVITGINKLAGREKPAKKAASYLAGVAVGLMSRPMATIVTEGGVGMTNGDFNEVDNPVIDKMLENIMRRHEEHHDKPWDATGGLPKRRVAAYKLMKKLGIITENTPALYQEIKK